MTLTSSSQVGTIPDGKLITVSEMAERLSLTPATVRTWARQGKLKAVKVGDDWRFPEGGSVMGRRNASGPEGIIRRPGSNCWYIRVNGKYVSTGTDDLNKAQEMMLEQRLKEIRGEGKSNTNLEGKPEDQLSFPIVLDRYLKEISPTKCQGGRNDWIYAIMPRKFLASYTITQIKPQTVYQYIEWRKVQVSHRLNRPVSGATINREIALIKHLLNQCVYWGLIETSPLPYKSIDRKGVPKEEPRDRYITDDEYNRIKLHLGETQRQICESIYFTGQRTGKIFTLQWRQINFADSTISFHQSSRNKRAPDTIPIPPEILPLLGQLWEERKQRAVISPWVFCHHDGTQVKSIRKAWENACKKAGVQGVQLRDLRAKRVTDLQRSGVQQKVVMQLTGHSTVSIHERYNRPGIEDLKKALEGK